MLSVRAGSNPDSTLVKLLEQAPMPLDFLSLMSGMAHIQRPVFRLAKVAIGSGGVKRLKFDNLCLRHLQNFMAEFVRMEDPNLPWASVPVTGEALLRELVSRRMAYGWIIGVHGGTCRHCVFDYGKTKKYRHQREVQPWQEKPIHKR